MGNVLVVDVFQDFKKKFSREENQSLAQAVPFPPKVQSALSYGRFPKLTQYSHMCASTALYHGSQNLVPFLLLLVEAILTHVSGFMSTICR